MSDWAEDAMLKAFPREGTTYFLQLVDEPVLVEKKGQWGPYTLLSVNLQFFAIDEDENYHYMGPVKYTGKSCVFEDFTNYTNILLEVCYKVEGYKHGRHVDLEIKETFNRQYPSRTLQPEPAQPESGPLKPAPALEPSSGHTGLGEQGQPGAEGEQSQLAPVPPHSPSAIPVCEHEHIELQKETPDHHDPDRSHLQRAVGFYCKHCGERVG